MLVFKAVFISINQNHPCDYLRSDGEERMVSVEDYLNIMEPAWNAVDLSDDLIEELKEVYKHKREDSITDIILGGY